MVSGFSRMVPPLTFQMKLCNGSDGDRLISRRCEIEWAPHSPDLNPPYFYLWGYLKDDVYENNPQIIPELKRAITGRIRRISVEECVQFIDNFANRIHVRLQRRGAHLEHKLERQ